MRRQFALLLGGYMAVIAPTLHAQEPSAPQQAAPVVRDVRIRGAQELSEASVREAMHVTIGEPLADSPDHVADLVERRYHNEGYTFAHATATLDASTGALTLTIDEGVIDDVEFEGVDKTIARMFAEEFAMRAGDVFNAARAGQALDVLLRRTRGAVRPGRVVEQLAGATGRDDVARPAGAFDLVERNGRRILLVGLHEPTGRFKVDPDFGAREDWFTPVDGFVPSLGFGGAVFDHERFNHTYIAGHLSFKMASGRVGYALGFERPLFGDTKLYLGAELHDLTATDDQWQVSTNEAGLAALWSRRSYRDYYRRRGVQGSAALRVNPKVELLMALRSERQESLPVESDFSLWRRDQAFRSNFLPQEGVLNAILIGASVDGLGFERESLDATYRRHQLDTLLGERLDVPNREHDARPIWRLDWLSEISTGSDFDFSRHVVTGRARVPLSRHQDVGARVMGGWSQGLLPVQREFGIGGIGSIHGYQFKEAVGDSLALVNLEYAYSWGHGIQMLGLFDAGRVTSLTSTDAPWLKGIGVGLGLGDVRIDFGYKLNADFINRVIYGEDAPSRLQVVLRFGRTF